MRTLVCLLILIGHQAVSKADNRALHRSSAPAPGRGCYIGNGSFDRLASDPTRIREQWNPENFSNPQNHDPKNFKYLVHTVSYKFSARASFDFLLNQVAKNSCAYISGSLIDQNHLGTFGKIGFILRVPSTNILLASDQDIGSVMMSGNQNPDVFNRVLRREFSKKQVGSLQAPEQILLGTRNETNALFGTLPYNEVLVEGQYDEGIQITGIMINEVSGGVSESYETRLKQILELAAEEKLPVIYIK